MPQTTLDLLNNGIRANQSDAFRKKNLIVLPRKGSLIVSGDLHGHTRNFERIVSHADLERYPQRHVIFQEIIHGGPQTPEGGCLSYQLLLDVIRYKLQYPDQVHIIMGNHDTACICEKEVMKDGREMNQAVDIALQRTFPHDYQEIQQTLQQYLFSQPLAVKTANRLWMSHSLPSDRLADRFSPTIFARPLQLSDFEKPGSVYLLTWGRNMSQPLLDRWAQTFDVDLFILGHQPQLEGWSCPGDNLLIIASEHNHGCLVHIDLARSYTLESLVESIVPLSAIP